MEPCILSPELAAVVGEPQVSVTSDFCKLCQGGYVVTCVHLSV